MTSVPESIDTPPASPGDSQHQLALSIARAVRRKLPAPDSEEAIAASVEAALQEQACRNERLLADARVTGLGVVALLATVAALAPRALGLPSYPAWPALVGWVCLAGAAAFLAAVRAGWYRPEMRRVVPAVDAALIAAGGVVFLESLRPLGTPVAPGFLGTVAVSCAFVAFSGALRLSRHAAGVAALCAFLAWVVVAARADLRPVTVLLVSGSIFATGLLGARFTRVIREVITTEIARLRLTRLYADAQEAINAREEVLKIVSHDLRNPLSTIAMAADLLLDLPATEQQRERQIRMIKRAGDRMDRLIHDLLDVARIEAGRLPIEPRAVELDELLTIVLEMMEPLAREKGLQLATDVPAGVPAVRIDPDRIVQVFSNLIGNAVKFTPSGGQITIRAEPVGGKVRLAVVDTGPGIPPDQLPRIFGRMWQARRTDTRGIGLGLTIAKAIVEAHGEEIGVSSELGKGTEFWFTVQAE